MSSVVDGWLWPRGVRYRGHVRAVCDEQAGVGVPQGVDIQILQQTVQMHNSIQRTRSLPRLLMCDKEVIEV